MAALKQSVLMKNRFLLRYELLFFSTPIIFDGTWGREACCLQEGMLCMWCLGERQHTGMECGKLSCLAFPFPVYFCLLVSTVLFLPQLFGGVLVFPVFFPLFLHDFLEEL